MTSEIGKIPLKITVTVSDDHSGSPLIGSLFDVCLKLPQEQRSFDLQT